MEGPGSCPPPNMTKTSVQQCHLEGPCLDLLLGLSRLLTIKLALGNEFILNYYPSQSGANDNNDKDDDESTMMMDSFEKFAKDTDGSRL